MEKIELYTKKVQSLLHNLPNNETIYVRKICKESNVELFKEIAKKFILRDENYPHFIVADDGDVIQKVIWDAFPNPYSTPI